MAKTIYIYDEISPMFGYGINELKKDLEGVSDNEEITIRINSPGGSVFEGFAIYNYLKSLPNNKTVYIDALSGSIASLIMLAGNKVYASEISMIMIHQPSTMTQGNEDDLEKTIEILSKIKELLITAYSKNIGDKLTMEKLTELVNDETWMTANEAKEYGFIDDVVEPEKIAAIYSNINKSKMSFIDKLKNLIETKENDTSVKNEDSKENTDAANSDENVEETAEEVEEEPTETVEETEENETNDIAERVTAIETALEQLVDLVGGVTERLDNLATQEDVEEAKNKMNSNLTNKLNELGKKVYGKKELPVGHTKHPKQTNRTMEYREAMSQRKREIEDRTRLK